jgi:hypothetical protein
VSDRTALAVPPLRAGPLDRPTTNLGFRASVRRRAASYTNEGNRSGPTHGARAVPQEDPPMLSSRAFRRFARSVGYAAVRGSGRRRDRARRASYPATAAARRRVLARRSIGHSDASRAPSQNRHVYVSLKTACCSSLTNEASCAAFEKPAFTTKKRSCPGSTIQCRRDWDAEVLASPCRTGRAYFHARSGEKVKPTFQP